MLTIEDMERRIAELRLQANNLYDEAYSLREEAAEAEEESDELAAEADELEEQLQALRMDPEALAESERRKALQQAASHPGQLKFDLAVKEG